MSQPISPLNAFVTHVDPSTGRFTQEGFNYFSNLAAVVNKQASTITTLQEKIATLQKGQNP